MRAPLRDTADAGDVERLAYALEDRHAWIERGIGILEDDLERAAVAAQLRRVSSKRVLAKMQDRARAGRQRGRRRQRPSVDLPEPDSPMTPNISPLRR